MLLGEFLVKVVGKLKKFPIIRHWLQWEYEQIFATATGKNLFRGVYGSFDEALNAIPSTKGVGYDQPGPANMYKGRAAQVFPTDYPVLYWLKQIVTTNSKVFDFGGHIGVSFYAYESYLGYPEGTTWKICDVPAVTEVGRAFAKDKHRNDISFTNDLKDADGYDIFMASGSLQYLEKPLAHMLAELEAKPSHVIVNLLPLHSTYEYVTVQNIGTAFCPYKIFKKDKFIQQVCDQGYVLVDSWTNAEKRCPIPFHEEYSVKPYSGLYFKRVEIG